MDPESPPRDLFPLADRTFQDLGIPQPQDNFDIEYPPAQERFTEHRIQPLPAEQLCPALGIVGVDLRKKAFNDRRKAPSQQMAYCRTFDLTAQTGDAAPQHGGGLPL